MKESHKKTVKRRKKKEAVAPATVAMDYAAFLARKSQFGGMSGFEPVWMPDFLFDFQKSLVDWSVRKGRAAIFADCGLGKTPMQLVWAENVRRHTGKPVLILTPLAVTSQTVREAEKFQIEAEQSKDGTIKPNITVTNYERLHYFDQAQFGGVVCDESSILKSFTGKRQKQITRFLTKIKYRLLCTASAAPNDYIELGTSSQAIGELSYSDMLKRFFQQLDDKGQKRELKLQDRAEQIVERDPSYYKKLAFRIAQTIGQWRLKHHAVTHFWRWVASWSRACRMPSDLGFKDDGFVLPELIEQDHVIEPKSTSPGMLFNMPAFGMSEERAERRRTITERCEFVEGLVDHKRPAVVWCDMNDEANRCESLIADAEQVSGRTPDERKIELYEAFSSGELRVIVIKKKIGAWGLNWQHCADMVMFPTHSFEQYYQAKRRCWRFGQKNRVKLDMVATEGEVRVLGNMRRKAAKCETMFAMLVQQMNNSMRVVTENKTEKMEIPSWLR
jgi:hypothetical protein